MRSVNDEAKMRFSMTFDLAVPQVSPEPLGQLLTSGLPALAASLRQLGFRRNRQLQSVGSRHRVTRYKTR